MPKSKREKIVTTSRVEKKGKELKTNMIQRVREYVSEYKNIYLFECENFRTTFLTALRETLTSSKFFMGKNKVIIHAMGSDEASEIKPKICQLSEQMVGDVGLLFSDLSRDELEQVFQAHVRPEYARPGFRPTSTVELAQGPLYAIGAAEPYPISHTQEAYLRSLGLDTQLKNGVVSLSKTSVVCEEGEPLTVNQANILRALELKLAVASITLLGVYNETDGWTSFRDEMQ